MLLGENGAYETGLTSLVPVVAMSESDSEADCPKKPSETASQWSM